MSLKLYQQGALDALQSFLDAARLHGPARAFKDATGTEYRPVFGDMPYVCLRLPTGGGKTLLAAHAVSVAARAWMDRPCPVVLWLVPTKTIADQTVEALRNPALLPRRALDADFAGAVRVFGIADFAQMRPQDIAQSACIVVGTIQSLRVKDTDGRKVYAHHEDMEPHFADLRARGVVLPDSLEKNPDGTPRYSFANLLHLLRPLMIVDEAHNAVTDLTRDMQDRIRPAAILEFTATPRPPSNLLHRVGVQALREEEMVKLPIVLSESAQWQQAVNGAVAERAKLAALAARESGGIRPVVLYQAQDRGGEVTVEVLRRHLIDAEGVAEAAIAIATGDQRGLDGVDILSPTCPIEHVITVQALKEGWDCPFAYVFCSVANVRSAVAVEQLLGRVLRMPFARRRQAPELNKAYAFLPATGFGEAARALADRMVQTMGFEEAEAAEAIEAASPQFDFGGTAFGRHAAQDFTHRVPTAPGLAEALRAAGAEVEEVAGGDLRLRAADLPADRVEAIALALPEAARQGFREAQREWEDRRSPAAKGAVLRVPALMASVQGELIQIDTDLFVEGAEWTLCADPFLPNAAEFTPREEANRLIVDVRDGHVTWQQDGGVQAALDLSVAGWTPEHLAVWLSRELQAYYLHPSDLLRWLTLAIGHLTGTRGIAVAMLMRVRYALARVLRERIDAIRRAAQYAAYQQALFVPSARPTVSLDSGVTFVEGMYDGVRAHTGRWRPAKHFLTRVPAFDGVTAGEEEQCAVALEGLPQVRHWVRNVPKHPGSFWLPLADARFYPDFVATLQDGRLFVVEYKGALTAQTDDTAEKKAVGLAWERAGGGLFLIVEDPKRAGAGMVEQMRAKLGG